VQEGCHKQEIRKRWEEQSLGPVDGFVVCVMAGNAVPFRNSPLWKSRFCACSFFPFVFLPFSPICFFYSIHLFFLYCFQFFHLTLWRPTRYLYIRKARHANPIFAANFFTNSI